MRTIEGTNLRWSKQPSGKLMLQQSVKWSDHAAKTGGFEWQDVPVVDEAELLKKATSDTVPLSEIPVRCGFRFPGEDSQYVMCSAASHDGFVQVQHILSGEARNVAVEAKVIPLTLKEQGGPPDPTVPPKAKMSDGYATDRDPGMTFFDKPGEREGRPEHAEPPTQVDFPIGCPVTTSNGDVGEVIEVLGTRVMVRVGTRHGYYYLDELTRCGDSVETPELTVPPSKLGRLHDKMVRVCLSTLPTNALFRPRDCGYRKWFKVVGPALEPGWVDAVVIYEGAEDEITQFPGAMEVAQCADTNGLPWPAPTLLPKPPVEIRYLRVRDHFKWSRENDAPIYRVTVPDTGSHLVAAVHVSNGTKHYYPGHCTVIPYPETKVRGSPPPEPEPQDNSTNGYQSAARFRDLLEKSEARVKELERELEHREGRISHLKQCVDDARTARDKQNELRCDRQGKLDLLNEEHSVILGAVKDAVEQLVGVKEHFKDWTEDVHSEKVDEIIKRLGGAGEPEWFPPSGLDRGVSEQPSVIAPPIAVDGPGQEEYEQVKHREPPTEDHLRCPKCDQDYHESVKHDCGDVETKFPHYNCSCPVCCRSRTAAAKSYGAITSSHWYHHGPGIYAHGVHGSAETHIATVHATPDGRGSTVANAALIADAPKLLMEAARLKAVSALVDEMHVECAGDHRSDKGGDDCCCVIGRIQKLINEG